MQALTAFFTCFMSGDSVPEKPQPLTSANRVLSDHWADELAQENLPVKLFKTACVQEWLQPMEVAEHFLRDASTEYSPKWQSFEAFSARGKDIWWWTQLYLSSLRKLSLLRTYHSCST